MLDSLGHIGDPRARGIGGSSGRPQPPWHQAFFPFLQPGKRFNFRLQLLALFRQLRGFIPVWAGAHLPPFKPMQVKQRNDSRRSVGCRRTATVWNAARSPLPHPPAPAPSPDPRSSDPGQPARHPRRKRTLSSATAAATNRPIDRSSPRLSPPPSHCQGRPDDRETAAAGLVSSRFATDAGWAAWGAFCCS